MTRTTPRAIHVVPDNGGWSIRAENGRSSSVHATQAEAVGAAQAMVRDTGGQLTIKESNGRTKKVFTLGRGAMGKINAVEGVVLSAAAMGAFTKFDQDDLSPTERRAKLRATVARSTKS